MKRAWLVVSLGLVVGCEGLGAGPCLHTYEDPLIRISVVNSISSEAVGAFTVTDFTLNGRAVEASTLLAQADGAELAAGSAIVCQADCGFATEEGTYTFQVQAEGFESKSVTVEGQYSDFFGGCPSSNAGSTELTVELEPAP